MEHGCLYRLNGVTGVPSAVLHAINSIRRAMMWRLQAQHAYALQVRFDVKERKPEGAALLLMLSTQAYR